jgi:H/ACA ribonucleoprotein complex subunit 4
MEENLLIKNDEPINKNLGKYPHERTIDELLERGIIAVDKDAGPTSHQTSDYLKRILKVEKAGHSGTLDPAVTGVLVCGTDKATRLMEYMLKSNKEYVCLMYIHKPVTKEKVEETFKQFTGKILQMPPIVSAVRREEREREIYYINLLEYKDEGQNILFRVGCQHGTYIRKLCSDIGESLGVGAQMKELRRTKAGPFKETDNIIGLDKLRNLFDLYRDSKEGSDEEKTCEKEIRKYIKPYEDALIDFKKVFVHENAVNTIAHGADLAIPGVAKLSKGIVMGEEIVMLTPKCELLGIGTALLTSEEVMKKNKGMFIDTKKVFIEPGYYPHCHN